MFIRDGQEFDINAFHVIGENQYPIGWFRDAENRAAAGVTEIDDTPPVTTQYQTAIRGPIVGGVLTWSITNWTQEQIANYEAVQIASKQLDYTTALEEMYDTKAHERHYDNRFTCALRAGYAGPFQAEGTAFAVWMDDCNATAYGIMAQVLAGSRPYPTKAELLAMMPVLVWPA